MLDDGSYEGLVVDATDEDGDATALSIVIVAGAHKGDVVEVRSASRAGDVVDLLGMPCVLRVLEGQPAVVFD